MLRHQEDGGDINYFCHQEIYFTLDYQCSMAKILVALFPLSTKISLSKSTAILGSRYNH
jgi:hypothetical protein